MYAEVLSVNVLIAVQRTQMLTNKNNSLAHTNTSINVYFSYFRLSPLGVFFLITAKIMEIDSFSELVGRLGLYFMTVLLGLFIHGFGTLSILFILATKKLPCRYIAKMGQVMATAFGTASR